MNSKKIIAAVLGILIAAFSFTACGDSKDDKEAATDVTASAAVTEKVEDNTEDNAVEKELAPGMSLNEIEMNKTTLKELGECWDLFDLDEKCEYNAATVCIENTNDDSVYYADIKKGAGDTYGDCVITKMENAAGGYDFGAIKASEKTTVQEILDAGFEAEDGSDEWLNEVSDADMTGLTVKKDGKVYELTIVSGGENKTWAEGTLGFVELAYNEADIIK